jgi:hypothetical protein
VFENFISGVKIQGVQVEYVGLHEVMHGKEDSDYVSRVEPSAKGGQKMAELIVKKLF